MIALESLPSYVKWVQYLSFFRYGVEVGYALVYAASQIVFSCATYAYSG